MGNICSIQVGVSCDAIFTRCLDCTVKRAKYIWDLEDNLRSLETELQKLTEARNDVVSEVTRAEGNQMERTQRVGGWLSRVATVEADVSKLLASRSQEREKLCFGGYCSKNCMSSYKFGREVTKKLKDVATLQEEGHFKEVVRSAGVPVYEMPIEPTVGLQSTFDEVWRFLRGEEVGIIGLYGTGGVGKTTLLKQINNGFRNKSHHFDVVIWVVVSSEPNLEKIQEDIGEKIGLLDGSWKDKRADKKALDIYNILKNKKFVLLLDDIWKRIDLTNEIGVPPPSPENKSKIVFTTRSLAVCGEMNAEPLRVQCLAFQQAWKLFERNLQRDVLDSHPGIREQAEIVVKKCDGLPLALITISRAMSCKKTLEEWRNAVFELKRLSFKFAGKDEKVYPLLKFSYDTLTDDTIRSCLLYCSLFPEDQEISEKDLINYWIGEGYFDGYDGVAVNDRGCYIIGVLVDACLLEKGEKRGKYFVKMHDVIREVALWIACEIEKERENMLVQVGIGLTEAPETGKWEGVKRVSLMKNKIQKLVQPPRCCKVQTLFLGHNYLETIIPSDFFQSMPSLKVLDLSWNLNLKFPSGISNLVLLQYLNLSSTAIEELPIELKALENLKYLNLVFTRLLSKFPRHLISSFSKLHVLEMLSCGSFSYDRQAENSVLFGGGELLVDELIDLKNLNVLTITLRNSCVLHKVLSSKLRNSTRSLYLEHFDLDILSLSDLGRLEELRINNVDLEELKIENVRGTPQSYRFQSLRSVSIINCSNLRNLTWLVFIPNLNVLHIDNCGELREIVSVEKMGEVTDMLANIIPFENLQFLTLSDLRNLKSIYPEALPFPHLEKIIVLKCPKLEKLPLDSNSAKERKIAIRGGQDWWNKLQWMNEGTQDAFLHSFTSVRGF